MMVMGKRTSLLILLSLLIVVSGILWCVCSHQKANPLLSKKVFIIQSDEETCKDYADVDKNIHKYFLQQGIDAEIHSVYLDCEHLFTVAEEKKMRKILDAAQKWNPDIILTFNDQATYSLMSCGHPIARKVPVIFSGVNYPNWAILKKFPNVKGFWDKPDIMGTVKLIKDIHGPRCVCFWQGESLLGRKSMYYALKTLYDAGIKRLDYYDYKLLPNGKYTINQSEKDKDAEFYANTSMTQKPPKKMEFSSLESYPNIQDRIFLKLSYPKTYKVLMRIAHTYTSRSISYNTHTEGFTTINRGFCFGEGLVGGYFTTLQTERRLAVQLATSVMTGKKSVESLGYYIPPKEYVVDWQAMKEWNIHKSQIPRYCRIVNISFCERYRTLFNIIFTLAVLALVYVVFRVIKKERFLRLFAQKELKRNERFLTMALSSGKIYPYESDAKVFNFDKDFYQINGLPDQPVPMDTFRKWMHPEDREKFDQLREKFWVNPEVWDTMIFQRRLSFHGEPYSWWELRYSYSQEDHRFWGLCLNVDSVKKNEQLLITAKQKAEESERMKTVFLAEMSHEIRTPLNAVVGFANLLATDCTSLSEEERTQYSQIINTHCDLLLKLVDNILDLSRIEAGRTTLCWTTCRLNDLFSSIYTTERQLIPENLELKLDLPETSAIALTDTARLTQVISNLINNAVKFTEHGYIAFGYRIVNEGKEIEAYVEDTGKGIPQDAQQAIFERFNKLDTFTQGVGLGLSICKSIVKLFGGAITLRSEEGKGSRFTVLLPLSPNSAQKS